MGKLSASGLFLDPFETRIYLVYREYDFDSGLRERERERKIGFVVYRVMICKNVWQRELAVRGGKGKLRFVNR